MEECRRTMTVLPATTTIERLCADALAAAERCVEERITERLDAETRTALDALLSETIANGTTRCVWLRHFEPGANSATTARLLERLEFPQRLDVGERIIEGSRPTGWPACGARASGTSPTVFAKRPTIDA